MSAPRHAQRYPEGLCACADCRAQADAVAGWRALVELENALHAAKLRRRQAAIRFPEPTQADDTAPALYRRTALDVLADDA